MFLEVVFFATPFVECAPAMRENYEAARPIANHEAARAITK